MHTKEPWQFERIPAIFNPKLDGFQIIAATPNGADVMTVALCTVGEVDEQNARRIVACVNACAELTQDALDGGWTALGMSRHARNVEKQRDELLRVLTGVAIRCGGSGYIGQDGQYLKAVREAIAKVGAGETAKEPT